MEWMADDPGEHRFLDRPDSTIPARLADYPDQRRGAPDGTNWMAADLRPSSSRKPPHLVIARSAATRQSMRRFSFPKRPGNLQGRLDCHGPAALAMTRFSD
jgi:hypothetical protein